MTQHEENNPITQDVKGYLSAADKKKFTTMAGVFCILFFLGQLIVPIGAMMIIMPTMMFKSMSFAEVESGAAWQDKIWFIEKTMNTGGGNVFSDEQFDSSLTLKSVDLNENESITDVEIPIAVDEPQLLAGANRLWIVSSSFMGVVENGHTILPIVQQADLGDISTPFLYGDNPAVIEEHPTGYRLLEFQENKWSHILTLPPDIGDNNCCFLGNIKVLDHKGTIYFFLKQGGAVYVHSGFPGLEEGETGEWQHVASAGSGWDIAIINNFPAVFVSRQQETQTAIIGYSHTAQGRWQKFFSHTGGIPGDIGVYPLTNGGFVLAKEGFPGSFSIIKVEGSGEKNVIKGGSGFFFPSTFMYMVFIPQGIVMLLPLILAFILSVIMKKHRIVEHSAGTLHAHHASLVKRAIAQVVDVLILAGPFVAGWFTIMSSFTDSDFMPGNIFQTMFSGFGLMAGGFVWIIACVFLYSFMEGYWGTSPGKWLVGIRVMGTDLQTCGFGRALIRNLLKFVDGFFNFTVGIMVVALSENWQRIGDMAARTVVIDIKK